ncbi:hypothetical protein [Pseudocolwellia sp. HL-MZ7]|uniref:hypothetical protein n=1 Tax=Pseudocolwellia sp. HL-MZ7 TaxID=3400627 RepID=UPI003CF56960
MKNIFQSLSILLVISLSVSFAINVKANVYQQLTSNDLVQVKLAAQTMYAGREVNRENADILAEILLSKYENALTTEVDTLAWACKTLAATKDGRYRDLLIRIAQSDAPKKLRKYAKSSYKQLPEGADRYKKGTLDLAALQNKETVRASKVEPILPKADLNKKERMLFTIAKGDLGSIKHMAQTIYAKEETDTDITDALSEFLLIHYKDSAEYQADTLAWICRGFGELDNGRYTQVMELVSEKTNHIKIRRYANSAYKDLPKAENSYVKGTVNFQEIIEKYKAI